MIDLQHGDCLELLPKLADNSIDLIVTDPPYGMTASGTKSPTCRACGASCTASAKRTPPLSCLLHSLLPPT